MSGFAQQTVLQTFDFEQTTPSAIWTIKHNLTNPVGVDTIVDIAGYGSVKMIPLEVDCTVAGTVIVTFSNPYSGVARIVS
ncbi:MAG: hypothetical protein QXN55_01755 [Candidatus Nitrosotenuis sp.]